MTSVKYIMIFIICVVFFVLGILSERYTTVPIERIRIVEKLKQVTKYVRTPATCDEFMACYYEHIMIDGHIVDQLYFLVTATDKCKLSERKFKLEGTARINPNLILLNYVQLFNFGNGYGTEIGGNLSYYRMIVTTQTFNFGLGGGAIATNKSVGFNLGTVFQF